MNASQIHLALTHLPVVLSLAGMVALAISFIKTNIALRRTALYILLIAGVAALPVFFTGEGAEEVVEHMPGVSDSLIERHEEVAKLGLITILAAAVLALISLLRFLSATLAKRMAAAVLLISLVSTGLMAQTAHLGGQIRHTEIRQADVQQQQDTNKAAEKEQDDD